TALIQRWTNFSNADAYSFHSGGEWRRCQSSIHRRSRRVAGFGGVAKPGLARLAHALVSHALAGRFRQSGVSVRARGGIFRGMRWPSDRLAKVELRGSIPNRRGPDDADRSDG